MDFDINRILVPITLAFLAVWLADKLWLKQRKTRALHEQSFFVKWAYEFLPILTIILVLRSFLFEPFSIPSGSMIPTLKPGDFILVNKMSFGLRLPLFNTKVLDTGHPTRGDVMVFRFPQNPNINFIKRVIGLPGDTIVFNEGQLTINGQPVKKVALPAQGDGYSEQFFTETLGNKTFTIRERTGEWMAKNSALLPTTTPNNQFFANPGHYWQIKVPEGHYFMMGDNRDDSNDSRFWGFVPEQNISGKAIYVWMYKEGGMFNLSLPSFARNGRIN